MRRSRWGSFSPHTLSRCRETRSRAGFTLIEVLIAVTLLAIISLLVWQAMGGAIASKERFEKREMSFRQASLALERISRDLAVAVLYVHPESLGVSESGEQSIKSVLIGVNNGDQDKLTFDTLSHIRYLKDVKESDLAEVSYFLEPGEEREEETTGLLVLKKRESSPPDTDPDEGGTVTTLLEGVKELNFRYFDPVRAEYGDEWDTTKLDFASKLPRAVEITLVVADPLDEENSLRFLTVAMIEMAQGPNDFYEVAAPVGGAGPAPSRSASSTSSTTSTTTSPTTPVTPTEEPTTTPEGEETGP